MTKEELIKILEKYEVFVDDDYGGSYQSIIAYTSDKKVSRAHTPIGTLKIIDTFEEIQNQNKKYKEVIDEAIEILGKYTHFTTPSEAQNSYNEDLVDKVYNMLKEVE